MRKYLTLLFFISILGCKPAPDSVNQTPSAAPAPIFTPTTYPIVTPTFTSTPQPPLKEHEWSPTTVLLRLDFTRGDTVGNLLPVAPPHFILYADGSAFVEYPLIGGIPYGDQQLLFKKLEREETCKILNTLDQTGFLDYDPSSYKSNASGAGGAYIEVNTWKSHKMGYSELPLYIFEELMGKVDSDFVIPVISPSLRKAYQLLVDYPADGFEVYQPEKLVVWLRQLDPETDVQWEEWKLATLSLSGMFSRMNVGKGNPDEPYLVLRGAEGRALYKFLHESYSTKYYYEIDKRGEKKYYALYARPLLPYELPDYHGIEIPAPDSPRPNFKLKCQPSDGVMPIPTPDLIYNLPTP